MYGASSASILQIYHMIEAFCEAFSVPLLTPHRCGAKTGFAGSRVTTPYIAHSTSYHVELSQPLEGERLS
jgi:hypothetical protein